MNEFDYIEYATEIRVSPDIRFLKEEAYRKAEMPEGLTSAAQSFYLKARLLYCSSVSPEQGMEEMRKIKQAYERDKNSEKNLYGLAELWKTIEPAAREYAKNPCVETGDAFYAAVYHLPNDWRLKR